MWFVADSLVLRELGGRPGGARSIPVLRENQELGQVVATHASHLDAAGRGGGTHVACFAVAGVPQWRGNSPSQQDLDAAAIAAVVAGARARQAARLQYAENSVCVW